MTLKYASPRYQNNINIIPDTDLDLTISDQLFLETLLCEIRGLSIEYASRKNKIRNILENKLKEEINNIESRTAIIEEKDAQEIENKKNELEKIRKEKLKGNMIRSRAKWVEEGEKVSKFFCSLESKNYINKTIYRLEKNNGQQITKQNEILKEIEMFYKDLYSKHSERIEDIDLNDFLSDHEYNILTNSQKISIEGELSENEILTALKNMKNNKSPGSDGFTSEFYKFFWQDVKHFILRSLNEGYRKGELSITQKQGIITCIPKGNKPRQFLKNWRPITLLNITYKLASACIANRLKTVLDSIISKTQTGFLSGRYIGENTRLIYDIMNYTEQHNIPGQLIFVDFEKAFDSVSWDFLSKVLSFFNFGNSIQKWIQTFNTSTSSAIIQNGFLSNFVNIKRGCRQGDPVSSYLFLLVAEILAIMVKNNKNFKGIQINNKEHRLSQFADDTSFILNGSKSSFIEAIDMLNKYAKISGLKVNTEKNKCDMER